MPVYTLNPSHRRATKRKASSTPSLRERVAAKRRNGLSEDGAVVSNPRSAKGSGYVNVTLSTAKGQTIREERYDHPWFSPIKLDGIALDMARYAPIGSIITIQDGALEDRYKVVDSHLGNGQRGVQKMRRRKNPLSEDGMVVSNPAKRRGGGRSAQKAGLAKGQSLMAQAAAAYRAGKYTSMQDALKGVARGGARRKNPLSEDGVVVSNPAKRGKGKAKRSGGRTAAQSNAAKAMKLFHSGKASSLAEAWDMVRRGR